MTIINQKFDSHDQWISKAHRVLTNHPLYYNHTEHERWPERDSSKDFRTLCFDSKGRQCNNGGDFKRAKDEDAFPVYYFWPDQLGELVLNFVKGKVDV